MSSKVGSSKRPVIDPALRSTSQLDRLQKWQVIVLVLLEKNSTLGARIAQTAEDALTQ